MSQPETSNLDEFFSYIYGQETGYVYFAAKRPGLHHAFSQYFFEWPAEKDKLVQFVHDKRSEWECYYAPALFQSQSASKADVKGSSVVWAEFDGNVPASFSPLPEPTLRVQSSNDGHEHCYWRLAGFLPGDQIERINRAITYALGADSSGWDACQILRPPETLNHKRERQVVLLDIRDEHIAVTAFDNLAEPPPPVEAPVPEHIPAVQDVIFRYRFTDSVAGLFKHGVAEGHRSTALMSLGYYLAEMNLTNEEMLSVLLNADERWGKFSGRSDQLQRLMEIITIARHKYPFRSAKAPVSSKLQPLGYKSILATDIHMEWVWEGYLQKAGYMLLTGPSGVGKTMLSLDVAAALVNGTSPFSSQLSSPNPAHSKPVDGPVQHPKIGFFSLEMGLGDLKVFLETGAQHYTPEELDALEERLKFFPLGEPLLLNKPEVGQAIEDVIMEHQLDGLIFDSLGSATNEELSDDTAARKLMHWNDMIRQKHGCFTWYIHHHRKAQSENKRPNKLSDVFGSQYWTSYATSVVCLWPTNSEGILDFIPLKVRLARKPNKFNIRRDEHFHFSALVSNVVAVEEVPTDDETTEISAEDTENPDKKGIFSI